MGVCASGGLMIFEDVVFTWQGDDYTLKASEVMRTIAKVESVVSVMELSDTKRPPLTRIAEAYSICLAQVGVKVEFDEVYSNLFSDDSAAIQNAILGLLSLMIPPRKMQTLQPDSAKKK